MGAARSKGEEPVRREMPGTPEAGGWSRRELLQSAALTLVWPKGTMMDWADVTAFLEKERQVGTMPGAALIASKKGKVVFKQGMGTYCSLARKDDPLQMNVRHPLYSFSKLVSATVVAMAHQDGLIDYDAPAKTYIPEFVGGGKEKITLRHLLTHSAGIPNVPLGAVRSEAEWKSAIASVCGAKTEWEPGSRTAYHALTGLLMAAETVRRVSGSTSWAQICREHLFIPLGAKSLTFEIPADTEPVAITPQPKEPPKSYRDAFGLAGHPAGGCFGTIEDGLKILQLHLNKGQWGRKRLLSAKAIEEMHTVAYRKEMAEARAAGKAPLHEPWGLGMLLRGDGAAGGSQAWFGFQNQTAPGVFGHAGIDTVIGVADPESQTALFFVTTDSPKPAEKTVPLRNGVTDGVMATLRA